MSRASTARWFWDSFKLNGRELDEATLLLVSRHHPSEASRDEAGDMLERIYAKPTLDGNRRMTASEKAQDRKRTAEKIEREKKMAQRSRAAKRTISRQAEQLAAIKAELMRLARSIEV